jgi:hypothetical protein
MKIQPIEWEKFFACYSIDKEYPKYIKFRELNTLRKSNSVNKWAKKLDKKVLKRRSTN